MPPGNAKSVNIISLISEGGGGKTALVTEWVRRLQAEDYRGAEMVLGWSFYSQGTKERATSADQFLNWALDRLGIKIESASAAAKGEALAEAMVRRRVLLILDGLESLQQGPGSQVGQLKDLGLRSLLRRFASAPPTETHGLVVITSRLLVKDIARWSDSTAPVIDLSRLSDEAGAALLRDNGVWGTDEELKAASHDFGGHPLALSLLAAFLKEKHFGDVRRRDHVRNFLADDENPRHDHARRVMESYEKDWLTDAKSHDGFWSRFRLFRRSAPSQKTIMLNIMHIVGLFDRPASNDCVRALRQAPGIKGLTEFIVPLTDEQWGSAIQRLREVRLLAPESQSAPGEIDAHPLIREWFGERLRITNEAAWRTGHGRLYEHLRDSTKDGDSLTFDELAPLYHAIAHGCCAGRHQEALHDIYATRIWLGRYRNGIDFYAMRKLGVGESELPAMSWFFQRPYEIPVPALTREGQLWVLSQAAFCLRGEGRFAEALTAYYAALTMAGAVEEWKSAAASATSLSRTYLLTGDVQSAIDCAANSVRCADRSDDDLQIVWSRAAQACAIHAAGRIKEAEQVFSEAEERQRAKQPSLRLLYSVQGYNFCDLLLAKGDYASTLTRARKILGWEVNSDSFMDRGLVRLALGRAEAGLLLGRSSELSSLDSGDIDHARELLNEAVNRLRIAGQIEGVPPGLLARAAFRRCIGEWGGAALDLAEIEEIAGSGPLKLYLCDLALEQARLAFAKIEAFTPLNGFVDNSPPKPVVQNALEAAGLKEEAAKQLTIAADYIETCGYHRRDEELAELQAVLRGERKFAELPPRV
jgi:tetratricopeptide (TPR) repeat protein